MTDESIWENVNRGECQITQRLKVNGGYLYHRIENNMEINAESTSMCFVPDVDLQRYQAHLRDAYNQGFSDGATDAHSQYRQKSD